MDSGQQGVNSAFVWGLFSDVEDDVCRVNNSAHVHSNEGTCHPVSWFHSLRRCLFPLVSQQQQQWGSMTQRTNLRQALVDSSHSGTNTVFVLVFSQDSMTVKEI